MTPEDPTQIVRETDPWKEPQAAAISTSDPHSILHITPDLIIRLSSPPPNWWWRLWHWILLGWDWEQVPTDASQRRVMTDTTHWRKYQDENQKPKPT